LRKERPVRRESRGKEREWSEKGGSGVREAELLGNNEVEGKRGRGAEEKKSGKHKYDIGGDDGWKDGSDCKDEKN